MIDVQTLKSNNDIRELAARHTELTSKGRNGKESEGACPRCGGKDRFYCQAEFFACRHCHPARGDAIELVQWLKNMSFKNACAYLDAGYKPTKVPRPVIIAKPPEPEPPHEQWEARAAAFTRYASQQLWNESNSPALSYLLGRGLNLDTIEKYDLGYNPKGFMDKADNWGLKKKVWIPAGIMIPSIDKEKVKNVKIRLMNGKWRHIIGGIHTLYLSDDLRNKPVVVCEAELDALSVKQEAGDVVSAAAVCGANGSRQSKWIAKLINCKKVLIAFDADETGDEAAEWWLSVLGRRASRLRPTGGKDTNEMLQANGGESLREWVLSGLSPQKKIRPIELYVTAEQTTLGFNIPERVLTHYDYE